MKVKNDHRSKFSTLIKYWKEEAWKKFTVMIILHFHLQLRLKYELFHIYFTLIKYCNLAGSNPEAPTNYSVNKFIRDD